MEDKRNRRYMSREEFKRTYTDELLARNDLSNVTRDLLIHEGFDLCRRYYWVCDAVKAFLDLDNYLKYNITDLDSYRHNSTVYLNGDKYSPEKNATNAYCYFYNTPAIKVCLFSSSNEDNPYSLFTDGYPGELHYQLKDSIRLKDVVDNNQGVLSIDVDLCGGYTKEYLVAKKDYISDGLYYEEEYNDGSSNSSINVTVYDLKSAIKPENHDPFNGDECENLEFHPLSVERKYDGCYDAKRPWFLNRNYILYSLNIYQLKNNPGNYEIEYWDNEGRHNEKINDASNSIYEVYYNYMVKKGYFKEKEENHKVLNKKNS